MPRVHTHTTQSQPTAAFVGTDGYSHAPAAVISISVSYRPLTGRLSIHKAEFRTLTHSRQMNNGMTHKRFRSLTAEMIMAFYQIITPGSISKKNPFNPFPAGEIQLRNFLICRLLLNYVVICITSEVASNDKKYREL